jgi:hypothetical protein
VTTNEFVTRKEALAQGLPHYFVGKTCIRGHVAPHSVRGGCVICNTDRQRTPKYVAQRRSYYCENADTLKEKNGHARLRRLYGIGPEQYAEMLEQQDHRCAICRHKHTTSRKLCVDHCHKTGRVRGLLCNNCNKVTVGTMENDPTALARLIEYMRNG